MVVDGGVVVVRGVVGVVGVVLVGVLGQVSLMEATPAGSFNDDGGTPGGKWKMSFCPVISVTTTVHSVADALGSAAMPSTARVVMSVTAPTTNLRLLRGDAFLPPSALRNVFLQSSVVPASLDSLWPRAGLHPERLQAEATD